MKDPYKFERNYDDTARIRIRFQPDEADTIEDATSKARMSIPAYIVRCVLRQANLDLGETITPNGGIQPQETNRQ